MKVNIFWFRRDLRLEDNTGLSEALKSDLPVLPVFIFDTSITGELPVEDPRISFIYETLLSINSKLSSYGSSLYILKDTPVSAWDSLIKTFDIAGVYFNRDYEPYAVERDFEVTALLKRKNIHVRNYKDHVIFEAGEILKADGRPYTVFTPYKKKWLGKVTPVLPFSPYASGISSMNFMPSSFTFPSIAMIGFKKSLISVRPYDLSVIDEYDKFRDIPSADRTSYLSPHLRFGTVSIREITDIALKMNHVFAGELIWREFFMQILFHFPGVVTGNFRKKYDDIEWRNNEPEFEAWCRGETGYPIVDAGMRQLNKTGYMHNRVRMIAASFLCKHLLVDWRWGEAYFAQKLLDFELSSNNGNWQWSAGTGCDAAPYFRIFNPSVQQKKYDPGKEYIRKWVEDTDSRSYGKKIVDHEFARLRALSAYNKGIRRHAPDTI
jgi:deoxyribodipyrimidine photo-lyase